MATYKEVLDKWNAHFGEGEWSKEMLPTEDDYDEFVEALFEHCETECVKKERYGGKIDTDPDWVGKPFEIVRRATEADEYDRLAMPVWIVKIEDNVFGARPEDIFEDPKNHLI